MFDVISEQLGGQPWLLGDTFSAADLFLFMLIRWSRGMPRPARTIPNLGDLANRVAERPAVREALVAEGLPEPWF
jgi:glutathione S-transferase